MDRALEKINTLSKIIEVLLTILHYEQCKLKDCDAGSICVDAKMKDLNVNIYSRDELYLIHDDL
jgi:hypothetical protein